jgi:hypothetical protein
MKGIRYSADMGQVAALMRSHGPHSGSQYDLLKGMIGGVSQRQLRYLLSSIIVLFETQKPFISGAGLQNRR